MGCRRSRGEEDDGEAEDGEAGRSPPRCCCCRGGLAGPSAADDGEEDGEAGRSPPCCCCCRSGLAGPSAADDEEATARGPAAGLSRAVSAPDDDVPTTAAPSAAKTSRKFETTGVSCFSGEACDEQCNRLTTCKDYSGRPRRSRLEKK